MKNVQLFSGMCLQQTGVSFAQVVKDSTTAGDQASVAENVNENDSGNDSGSESGGNLSPIEIRISTSSIYESGNQSPTVPGWILRKKELLLINDARETIWKT